MPIATRILLLGVLTLCTLLLTPAQAQLISKFVEFFTLHPNWKAVQQDSAVHPAKLVLTPVIAYSPETSLEFGAGAKYLFKLKGSGPETRTSNVPVGLTYTLNNQLLFNSGYRVFFNQERYMLTGNLRINVFPQFYYGVGRNTPQSAEEEYSFTQLLAELVFLKQVGPRYLFVGAGLRYNYIGDLAFEDNSTLRKSSISGALGSTSVGTELALIYDSRDNILTAHRGWLFQLTQSFYGKVLGGTHKFQLTQLDLRKFIPLSSKKGILAFQLVASFSFDDVPLSELSALGDKTIMRGYYERRYLDNHRLAMQAEYRFRLYQRLGAVVFAGAGDVAHRIDQFTLSNLRPSVGIGLRFTIDQAEDLNLRLDYGVGSRTQNYYIKIAEAF